MCCNVVQYVAAVVEQSSALQYVTGFRNAFSVFWHREQVAVGCSGLQWVTVCCPILCCVALCICIVNNNPLQTTTTQFVNRLPMFQFMHQCVAVCCSVLQCVAVCCSVLPWVALCCTALCCVALR